MTSNLSVATILDLAHRQDGYFAPMCDDIAALRDAGLIRTTVVCFGYVVARAVPQSKPSVHTPSGRSRGRHPVGAFPRAETGGEVRA